MTLTESDVSRDETIVKHSPTAPDVAGLGEQYHLNLPGDTCVYARDFAKLKREGGAPAKRWRDRLPWRREAPVKAAPEPAR